jgi:NAD(P)H-dependent FMN reductase
VKLASLIAQHQALLIASPEYNSLITPLLKNTIDWCTRADPNPLAGKVAAIVSASPGAYGGVRGAQVARQLLLQLGCHVVPAQCSIPKADEAFEGNGRLKDPRTQKAAHKVAAELVRTTARLTA